jgi:hypothetical protein
VNERLQYILENEDMFIAVTFLDYKYRNFEFCNEGKRQQLQKRATEYTRQEDVNNRIESIVKKSQPTKSSTKS